VAKDLAIQTYSEEEVRYFDRTFTRLVVETPRGPLGLIPTHLLQHLAPLAERRSSLLAVFDLMANLNNPLGRQLTSLIQKLQERYGPSLDQNEGFALFGDLNFPSTVGFQHAPRLRTPYFQRLQAAGLTDAFSGQGPASFPTRHAPEARDPLYQLHPLQLDHAWASPGVGFRSPEILTLEGSDHYPLFFIARASGRDAEP
jgi:endonuclease/exonuclease/phosphatase family metal-dependent hydrolase